MPDTSNPHNVIHGAAKRLFADTLVQPNVAEIRRFRSFVRLFLRKNFKCINIDSDTSVETWLTKTNYTDKKKADLLNTWNTQKHRVPNMHVNHDAWKKLFKVKAFPKIEKFEQEFKEVRQIYSRSDFGKCYFGPYAKLMESQVYNHEGKIQFAKHIKYENMVDHISEKFGSSNVFSQTDFSSFEGSFSPRFMRACENQLYTYMLRNYPEVADTFCRMATTNHIKSKYFTAQIEGCRMSGEMTTSLANGFSNLMIHYYLDKKLNLLMKAGLVEGDDGLFGFGTTPKITNNDYALLGFMIKLEFKNKLSDTSFCSIVYNYETRTRFYSPYEFLQCVNFSHNAAASSSRCCTRNMLLHTKALSYLAQFPNSPVIGPICKQILNKTKLWAMNEAQFKLYLQQDSTLNFKLQRMQLTFSDLHLLIRKTKEMEVSMEDRLHCQRKFGMPIHEQLFAEQNFMCGVEWKYNWPTPFTPCSQNRVERIIKSKSIDIDFIAPRRVVCNSLITQFKYSQGQYVPFYTKDCVFSKLEAQLIY